jgi:tetratricopeptide (TPR) repeat protein
VDVSGDLDQDGHTDYRDVRLLKDAADDLLSAIKRGDLVAAIEDPDGNGSDYTSVQYFKQLDGLRFDEVVSLAGKPIDAPSLAALRQEAWCRQSTSQSHIGDLVCSRAGVKQLCDTYISKATATAFNTAIEAIELQQYAEARTAIEALDFSRLSPYERSKGQRILAQISYGEQDYPSARDHLQKAIDAGGLDLQQASAFRRQIDLLDAQLSAISQAQ